MYRKRTEKNVKLVDKSKSSRKQMEKYNKLKINKKNTCTCTSSDSSSNSEYCSDTSTTTSDSSSSTTDVRRYTKNYSEHRRPVNTISTTPILQRFESKDERRHQKNPTLSNNNYNNRKRSSSAELHNSKFKKIANHPNEDRSNRERNRVANCNRNEPHVPYFLDTERERERIERLTKLYTYIEIRRLRRRSPSPSPSPPLWLPYFSIPPPAMFHISSYRPFMPQFPSPLMPQFPSPLMPPLYGSLQFRSMAPYPFLQQHQRQQNLQRLHGNLRYQRMNNSHNNRFY